MWIVGDQIMAECKASFPSELPYACIQATLAALKAKRYKTAVASGAYSLGCLSTFLPDGTPKPEEPWAATMDVTQLDGEALVKELEAAAAGLPPEGSKGAISVSLILWLVQLLAQVLVRYNTPTA